MTFANQKNSLPLTCLGRYRVVIVDDDVLSRTLLEALLRAQHDYDVVAVVDAASAMDILRTGPVDAILIDTTLPDSDGYQLCSAIHAELGDAMIPTMLFASSATGADRQRAADAGASDLIVKPFHRTELMHRLRNLLHLKSLQDQLKEVEQAMLSMSTLIDVRDNYSHGHATRVAQNCELLGRAVGLSDSDIHLLRRAAFLKDVGKSGIPDEVLNNAVSWSQAERKTISERMALPWTQDRVDTSTPRLQPIIRHCRENFDGTGSPDKLSGDQIPLGSRLLSIVVAYDALTSQRPFRSAHSDSDARAVLLEGCGKQWDPQYVHVYLTCLDQVSNSSNCSNTVDLLAA